MRAQLIFRSRAVPTQALSRSSTCEATAATSGRSPQRPGAQPRRFRVAQHIRCHGWPCCLVLRASDSDPARHRKDEGSRWHRLRPGCRADAPCPGPAVVPGTMARRFRVRMGIPGSGYLGSRRRNHPAHCRVPQARSSYGQQQALYPRHHACRQPCRWRTVRMDRCPAGALDLGTPRWRLRGPNRTLADADLDGISGRFRLVSSPTCRLTIKLVMCWWDPSDCGLPRRG